MQMKFLERELLSLKIHDKLSMIYLYEISERKQLMRKQQNTQYGIKYYLTYFLWYTLLFALVAAGVFSAFVLKNRSFVWNPDAVAQYVPKASYFISETREILSNFLHGNFSVPLYDFSLGMGDAVQFHLEPLYWIFLLFDPDDVEIAYGIVFLARLYFAGISMSVFALYFKRGRAAALAGSMAYVFCDFAMWGGMRHSSFIVAMVMLPLCIISMEEILQKKRWYICTIVIWIHLWCSYYFTYMNTIAMGVYFLIRFFSLKEGRTFKNFWLRVRTVICSYLLGVLIGNITLVNTFSSYLTSSRTEAAEYGRKINMLFYGLRWVKDFFSCLIRPYASPGYWMRLGYIPLVFVALAVLFMRKGRKGLKASVIVGTIFCMIPAVAFVFSGFSNINNRWIYIYSFVMACVLAFTFEDMTALTKKEQICIGVISLPFLAYFTKLILKRGKFGRITLLVSMLLVLTIAVIWFLNYRKPGKKKAFAVLLCISLISHWAYGLSEYAPRLGNFSSKCIESGKVLSTITDTPLRTLDAVEDDTFYRSQTRKLSQVIQGASQCLDYKGTVYFTSTLSKVIQDFYRTMGLTSWSVVRMMGFDNRAFLDALASVKYYGLDENNEQYLPYGYTRYKDTEDDGKKYEFFENDMFLPVGYTYDSAITREELESYNLFERQEVIMQTAVLEDDAQSELPDAEKSDIKLTGKGVEITDIVYDNVEKTEGAVHASEDKEKVPTITVYFDAPENSEVYLCMKGLRHEGNDSSVTLEFQCSGYKKNYILYGTENIYWPRQEEYIFNMGYHEKGADFCTIKLKNGLNLQYDEIGIYCQSMDKMEEYTARLKENVLENVSLSTNRLEGTISLEEKKLLVFSIPYINGWKAYVDGKETPLRKANIMYMGLDMEPGEHTVELVYHMPGLTASLLISACGILILLAALLIRRRKRKSSGL